MEHSNAPSPTTDKKLSKLKKWLPAILLALLVHLVLIGTIVYQNNEQEEETVILTPIDQNEPMIETEIVFPEVIEKEENETETDTNEAENAAEQVNQANSAGNNPQTNKQQATNNKATPVKKESEQQAAIKPAKSKQATAEENSNNTADKTNKQAGKDSATSKKVEEQNPQSIQYIEEQPTQTGQNSNTSSNVSNGKLKENTAALVPSIDLPANEQQKMSSVLKQPTESIKQKEKELEALRKPEEENFNQVSEARQQLSNISTEDISQNEANKQQAYLEDSQK